MKFLTALIKPKNILLTLYFLIGNVLIFFAFAFFNFIPLGLSETINPIINGVIGIGINGLCMIIGLSSLGEALSRLLMRWKSVEKCEVDPKIQEIFNEVYTSCRENCPKISDKIKLYIATADNSVNAYALGKNSIAIPIGTIQSCNEDEIRGLFAHEFGHIYNNDSSLRLGVLMSNQVILGVSILMAICMYLCGSIITFVVNRATKSYMRNGIGMAIGFIIMFVYVLWNKLGMLVLNFVGRKEEYAADNYAVTVGYGEHLHYALSELDPSTTKQSLTSLMSSSHPDTVDRLAKIKEAFDLLHADDLEYIEHSQDFGTETIADDGNVDLLSDTKIDEVAASSNIDLDKIVVDN